VGWRSNLRTREKKKPKNVEQTRQKKYRTDNPCFELINRQWPLKPLQNCTWHGASVDLRDGNSRPSMRSPWVEVSGGRRGHVLTLPRPQPGFSKRLRFGFPSGFPESTLIFFFFFFVPSNLYRKIKLMHLEGPCYRLQVSSSKQEKQPDPSRILLKHFEESIAPSRSMVLTTPPRLFQAQDLCFRLGKRWGQRRLRRWGANDSQTVVRINFPETDGLFPNIHRREELYRDRNGLCPLRFVRLS